MQPKIFVWLSELTRRHLLLAIIIVFVSCIATSWALINVRDSVKEARAVFFDAVLSTQAEALKIWASERQADAMQWANAPFMADLTMQLLADRRRAPYRGVTRNNAHAIFADRIAPAVEDLKFAAANIVAPDRMLIASLVAQYIGATVSAEYSSRLAPVFDGRPVFIGPTSERTRLGGRAARQDDAFVWIAVPVKDRKGKVLAALCLGRRANGRFASMLTVARPGDTGEIYAFDRNGMLLSASRFDSDLKKLGLLPAGEALIPGAFPLLEHIPSIRGAATMPFTALVAQAIESGKSARQDVHGLLLEPYRNYIGSRVIGAWRWIPSLELGVALEMSEGEALAPVGFMDANLLILVSALGLAIFLGPTLPPVAWRRFVDVRQGERLGNYQLIEKLGEGGFADIYRAVHLGIEKRVAIKVMKGQLRETLEAMFEQEAKLLGSLDHEGIVKVSDTGRCKDGRFYYVMEFVAGHSLRAIVTASPVSPEVACEVLVQICEALDYLHGQEVIHGDIKPDNVMVEFDASRRPRIKLIDFGFARRKNERIKAPADEELAFEGTPAYTAPERIRNPHHADTQTDIYSIGALAYFLLARTEIVPDLNDCDSKRPLPDGGLINDQYLADAILKAMAPRARDRWKSCAELAQAIAGCSLYSSLYLDGDRAHSAPATLSRSHLHVGMPMGEGEGRGPVES